MLPRSSRSFSPCSTRVAGQPERSLWAVLPSWGPGVPSPCASKANVPGALNALLCLTPRSLGISLMRSEIPGSGLDAVGPWIDSPGDGNAQGKHGNTAPIKASVCWPGLGCVPTPALAGWWGGGWSSVPGWGSEIPLQVSRGSSLGLKCKWGFCLPSPPGMNPARQGLRLCLGGDGNKREASVWPRRAGVGSPCPGPLLIAC